MSSVLLVVLGVIYVAAGVVAGPKTASRLDASLGRLVAVLLWLLLITVVRIGFLLGWWDIFGREDKRHSR